MAQALCLIPVFLKESAPGKTARARAKAWGGQGTGERVPDCAHVRAHTQATWMFTVGSTCARMQGARTHPARALTRVLAPMRQRTRFPSQPCGNPAIATVFLPFALLFLHLFHLAVPSLLSPHRRGAAFGLAHPMSQLVLFRPPNRDSSLRNLYFVGASTTPGNGFLLSLFHMA